MPLVGRLAPSPTGAQHVGNARTYLLAWLSIRSRGGRIVMRMEDIDSPRIKRGADQEAIEDLRWLGLDWDEGPDTGGDHAPYVQSLRLDHYADALRQLREANRIYPCTCSRSDVLAASSAPHVGQEGPRYPGTCSHRRAVDAAELVGRSYCWRLRTTSQQRTLADQFQGIVTCNVQHELGDFVVAKGDGSPAYQLAVVADDHAMGVNEVLRGDDLLPSAFRQLELFDFFGWQAPSFCHVPLVVGPDRRRLAKRHGDTRLKTLRSSGVSAEQLVGFLAWTCGLQSRPASCRAADLVASFDLKNLPAAPYVFDDSIFSPGG